MDPEDSEPTAPAPTEGASADSAPAPAEDSSAGTARAAADGTPDAPAAASAPDAETPPEAPFDKRKFLEDPEIADWMEERVNARASKLIQRMQQQQAYADQQAYTNNLRQRARQGDYEAERELAAQKLAELDDADRTSDPVLTTRVLDGMVKNALTDPRLKLPPEVRDAAYGASTVYDFVQAIVQHTLKDYVPKTEAAKREAQAVDKERLRTAKTAPPPDLAPSAGIAEAPRGQDAEITAITERARRRGNLLLEERRTLERYRDMAV